MGDYSNQNTNTTKISTVGFLEPRTCTATSKLLRLAATRISHQQSAVVPAENVLDLLLRLLVDVLLVEGDESLRDRLTDGVDLGGVTSTFHSDTHVDTGESVATKEEDRLERLVAEDFRLDKLDRDSVNFNESTAALAVSDGNSRLLAAEALDGFGGRGRGGSHGCCGEGGWESATR